MGLPASACLIARNEEAVLATCLRSITDLFPDIFLVDTGSSDRTKEIAAQFGARVFDFPWCDDFSAARNEAARLVGVLAGAVHAGHQAGVSHRDLMPASVLLTPSERPQAVTLLARA